MALTKSDLKAIENILDDKLNEKFVDNLVLLEKRLDEKLEQKFDGINERMDGIDERLDGLDTKLDDFIEFAKPAITSLLDESQDIFEQKLPNRVSQLEKLHSGGMHTHMTI